MQEMKRNLHIVSWDQRNKTSQPLGFGGCLLLEFQVVSVTRAGVQGE